MDANLQTNPTVSSDNTAYYVYCVAERSAAASISSERSPAAIEDNSAIELIDHNQLAAVVSKVPLAEYGEEALAVKLTDASWTAVRAMRHEHVVEHFSKRTSVVPLRFGTIYLDQARIESMLTAQEGQLTSILNRLDGREEWGVNVYGDRTVLLNNIANVSARLREMSEEAKQASAGQSYLMQKKIEALKADEAKAEIARACDRIERELSDASEGAVRLRVLKVETTEHGELKAKFAFLVVRAKFEEFRNVAENLARKLDEAGIRIELTGPWPAYNFATV